MAHGLGSSIAAILIAIFSVQSGAAAAKQLFPLLGAEGATTLRLCFATTMLLAFFRPWRTKLTRADLSTIALYGLALGTMNLFYYLALSRIPLGIAVALEFTGPLAVALFSSRRPVDFLWATLAAAGILLILPLWSASQALSPVGVGFALGAGLCWALYIVFGQRAAASVEAGTATALGMTVATIVVLPIGVTQAGHKLLEPVFWPLGLAVALLSSAIPYSLEMLALKRLPARTFGILMSIEPAVAALLGLVFLREYLSLAQWLAIACIITASIGTSVSTRRDSGSRLADAAPV